MPDTRKHRGPGPEDREWFGVEARPNLTAAVADLSWLLSRGYAEASALKLVGDRWRLVERQRTAVRRSSCSDEALARRRAKRVELGAMRGRPVRIDGFNLVLTLESALGGGVVLGGRDGCFRDLASVYGTYRRVEETRPALDLAARRLSEWGIGPCTWLLDAPVSNSGRLAAMIRATAPDWHAEVVPDPDALLAPPATRSRPPTPPSSTAAKPGSTWPAPWSKRPCRGRSSPTSVKASRPAFETQYKIHLMTVH